jgi:hypothetical protein
MPRGSNATGPGAFSVMSTNSYLSRENAKASISAREYQFWVENVKEGEWKRNWEEGGVFKKLERDLGDCLILLSSVYLLQEPDRLCARYKRSSSGPHIGDIERKVERVIPWSLRDDD